MSQTAFTTPEQAHAGLCVLDLLVDLFTGTPREQFTRAEILLLLEATRKELFDPQALDAFEVATNEVNGVPN